MTTKNYYLFLLGGLLSLTTISCTKDEDSILGGNFGAIEGKIVYYGEANSIVISAIGDHKINVTPYLSNKNYKYTNTTTADLPAAAAVGVLWQTEEGLITNLRLTENKTEAQFSVNKIGSNALIALYNDAGQILWSFHIWCVEKPNDLDYQNGVVFMDRNLGSAKPQNGGLLYQWGRKDPFACGDRFNGENDRILSQDKITVSKTTGTIVYALQHPTIFLTSGIPWYGHDENPNTGDWFFAKEPNNKLWSAQSKSIYDPCPKGYKVSSNEDWQNNFTANNQNIEIKSVKDNDNYSYSEKLSELINAVDMKYDSTVGLVGFDKEHELKLYYEKWGQGNYTVVPSSPWLDLNEDPRPTSSYGSYWTTGTYKDSAITFWFMKKNDNFNLWPKCNRSKSMASSVRCIKE